MSIRFVPVVAAFAGLALAIPAGSLIASEAALSPLEMQKARHDHYHELGDAFKGLRDQTKASVPDFAELQKFAQIVNDASINQGRWFPKGTGPEAGKTRALPEIWAKPVEFEAAQKMLTENAGNLLATTKGADIEAVRAAFAQTGKACKNCHDTFRAPDDHN